LSQFRLYAGLMALVLAAGCKAQPSPNTLSPDVNRRVEVLVRGQFNVPADYGINIGERRASQISGYDSITITFTKGPKSVPFEFLLSKDGKTLARLDTYDLNKSPIFNIDTTGRPVRGNPNAKVTIISFDDLECPYCSRMHEALFPSTLDRYKDKIRFIYKDDPLVEIHPWAMHAAVDANCLADQNGDAYWAYVDYVHGHGQDVSGTDRNLAKSAAALDRIAREQATLAKLDLTKLDACIAKQDEARIQASADEAQALGIDGTPALFVNGERISGAVPEQQVWLVIDRALRSVGEVPPTTAPAAPAQGTGK
jgi:protein-disulfide isomerase